MVLPTELTTVTPLSKILAFILFISLPIIAFFYGMNYQKNITVAEKTLVVTTTPSVEPRNASSTVGDQIEPWMYEGIYVRLNETSDISDITYSTLGKIVGNKIDTIAISQYASTWASATAGEQKLLEEMNNANTVVSSEPEWNGVDFPVDLVGTIEYKNGTTGAIAVSGWKVGFQDSTGETWYFALNSDARACKAFMTSLLDQQYKIDISTSCDDDTFVELNHEYAKDGNHVYFISMPNANKNAVMLKDADPATFEIPETCPGLAIDKNYVYQYGEIMEGKDPIRVKSGAESCY